MVKYNINGIYSLLLLLFLALELIKGDSPERSQLPFRRRDQNFNSEKSENRFEPGSTIEKDELISDASTSISRRSLLDEREPGPYLLDYYTYLDDGYYWDYYYEYEYYFDDEWDDDVEIASIGYTSSPTVDLDNASNDFLSNEKR